MGIWEIRESNRVSYKADPRCPFATLLALSRHPHVFIWFCSCKITTNVPTTEYSTVYREPRNGSPTDLPFWRCTTPAFVFDRHSDRPQEAAELVMCNFPSGSTGVASRLSAMWLKRDLPGPHWWGPSKPLRTYSGAVVWLMNRYWYSAAEQMLMLLGALPESTSLLNSISATIVSLFLPHSHLPLTVFAIVSFSREPQGSQSRSQMPPYPPVRSPAAFASTQTPPQLVPSALPTASREPATPRPSSSAVLHPS